METEQIVKFGPFQLDESSGTLVRDGRPVEMGQRAFALLSALAHSQGSVSKQDLIDAAWPGSIVEEGNLTVQISALRKVLGHRSDGSDWIVTVPRFGYRLTKSPLVLEPGSTQKPVGSNRRPSIAVLPFQNLGSDPEQEFFADGVVEDIITALSRFKSLVVIARNSSFVYKGKSVDVRQVARDLGVNYVLEGSVRRAGDQLRVTAQLVDGISGAHLWARNFDGELSNVFSVQDQITESVSGKVYPRLEEAELARARQKPPGSLDAYDLVLQGRRLYWSVREEENAEALRLFLQAIEIEPEYATALSLASATLQFRLTVDWPPFGEDDYAFCKELLERSIRAGGDDPAIMANAGITLANNYAEYERGLALIDVAVSENPNNLMVLACAAITYLHCASVPKSIVYAKQAIALSPSDPGQHWALTAIAHANMALGQYEDALRWASQSLALNSDFDCTYWMLIAANAHLGRAEEASRWLALFRKMRPEVTVASIRAHQPARYPDRIEPVLEGLQLAGLPPG